jgi:hypothetical protein
MTKTLIMSHREQEAEDGAHQHNKHKNLKISNKWSAPPASEDKMITPQAKIFKIERRQSKHKRTFKKGDGGVAKRHKTEKKSQGHSQPLLQ